MLIGVQGTIIERRNAKGRNEKCEELKTNENWNMQNIEANIKMPGMRNTIKLAGS